MAIYNAKFVLGISFGNLLNFVAMLKFNQLRYGLVRTCIFTCKGFYNPRKVSYCLQQLREVPGILFEYDKCCVNVFATRFFLFVTNCCVFRVEVSKQGWRLVKTLIGTISLQVV